MAEAGKVKKKKGGSDRGGQAGGGAEQRKKATRAKGGKQCLGRKYQNPLLATRRRVRVLPRRVSRELEDV